MIYIDLFINKMLGRRGYVIRKETLTSQQIIEIKNDLTFINGDELNPFNKGKAPEKFPIYAENAAKMYLPRYYGLEKFGEPEQVHFTEPVYAVTKRQIETPFSFIGGLRDYQTEAVSKIMERFGTTGSGGILSMPCGFGKTRTTIYVLHKLKNEFVKKKKPFKAIIVVHKEFLAGQWKENIQQLIPEASIGTIQQDKVDVEGKDVVIAMLQSISMKDYPDDLFNQFDMAVFDECHHLAAKVFSKALLRIGCKYLLGLSATINRKDFCHDVFLYSIGPVIYKIDRASEDRALVHKLVINSDNNKYYTEVFNKYNGNKDSITMLTNLCAFPDRNELIVNIMRKLLEKEEGRKIIVFSSRRDDKHLGFIKDILEAKPILKKDKSIATCGYYIGRKGESKKKYVAGLKESEHKDIILCTYDLAKEGLDLKNLNTIILATPINGLVKKMKGNVSIEEHTVLEQSIGRILRDPPEQRKLIPIVVDLLDNFSNFVKWGYTRNAFYKKVKYPMTRHVITLNQVHEGRQKYNLDFLLENDIFYADEKKISEITEGIIRDDSSLSKDGDSDDDCMID